MRFHDIEVSGITRIVFNRTFMWKKRKYLPGEDPTWVCHTPGEKSITCFHSGMMRIVNMLKDDEGTRMWIHENTLNIESESIQVRELGARALLSKTLDISDSDVNSIVGRSK
jgi:hypothetical protein